MAWTDEEIEIVRDRLAKGDSAGIVGKAIGKTRSAVLGKALRLNIEIVNGRFYKMKRVARMHAPKVKKSYEAERITAKQTHAGKGLGDAPHYTPKPDFSVGKKTMLELATNDCRFICSDDLFCAAPKDEGSSYCLKHRRLCCQSMTVQPQKRADRNTSYLASNF